MDVELLLELWHFGCMFEALIIDFDGLANLIMVEVLAL